MVINQQLLREKLTATIVVECINAKEIFVSKTLACMKARGEKNTTSNHLLLSSSEVKSQRLKLLNLLHQYLISKCLRAIDMKNNFNFKYQTTFLLIDFWMMQKPDREREHQVI